jgi:hypothetical protein
MARFFENSSFEHFTGPLATEETSGGIDRL